MRNYALFLVNLLQDVNMLRPLAFMAARDLGLRAAFLVSREFEAVDKSTLWRQELEEIGKAAGVPVIPFKNAMEAAQLLQDKGGVLVAASESDRIEHAVTHDIFRAAPPSFLKVTLQHGFECLGFLHNAAHGPGVSFAADVICGWCDGARLASIEPSQRSKLYVTGPPTVLQMRRGAYEEARPETGLVCENLHSVRLKVNTGTRNQFLETFNSVCSTLDAEGRTVALRPHPGGQYALKYDVAIARNVVLNNHPMYKVDLRRYAYGISAPSSVLLDFVLAGIPAAVWRDPAGAVDAGNYAGLAEIRTAEEWLEFTREALAHPGRFLERQQQFLERQQMLVDPEQVYRRFADLFSSATRERAPLASERQEVERVLFVANSRDASLDLCLLKPLDPLVEAGTLERQVLTELQINEQFGKREARGPAVKEWLDAQLALFKPTLLVFSRYGGPHGDYLAARARELGIRVIYHIDDDLLNVPLHVGLKKHKRHNDPLRLATVRHLLDYADLVYCSTQRLKERLEAQDIKAPLLAGAISCSGEVVVAARERPVRKVGYMGIDKSNDLEPVLPALAAFLQRHPEVQFQLFGSFVDIPAALAEFGERVTLLPSVSNYDDFLRRLASLDWDIGIAPLASTPFNLCKANNKWIEYTSVGTAVVASRGTVYDESCAGGCGLLVETTEEWLAALEKLVGDPALRFDQVRRAQRMLVDEYSNERLRTQVLDVLARARS